MRVAVVLFACLAIATTTSPTDVQRQDPSRIVGGSVTTINQYPFAVVLLYSPSQTTFVHNCGGSILNQRSVLTAAHCFWLTGMIVGTWRSRVGSSFASSGGVIHLSSQIINHPQYNPRNEDNDVSILRLSTNIRYIPNTVATASIAGPNYNVADNQIVWAIGWGRTQTNGPVSEQLRHVQIWTINTATCRQRWALRNIEVTNNMLCSGWLDVGGRDQCHGDSGSPLLHNNVVVGVSSWGYPCADPFYPGVNTRISTVSNWIVANA